MNGIQTEIGLVIHQLMIGVQVDHGLILGSTLVKFIVGTDNGLWLHISDFLRLILLVLKVRQWIILDFVFILVERH